MSSNAAFEHGLQLVPESRKGEANNPKEVLREIFELLEEFGPAWYSEELHKRAITALKGN